jgi:hypothetical protein
MGAVGKKKSKSCKSIKMRGGAKGGTYTFTDENSENSENSIYFFSDIEGNMPDGIRNLMFETGDTPKTLGNEVIVFTGDLIDRGEYTIRNLQRMLALKKANDANVILLCGNRDANKIRMYHECHIQAIEDMILKSENKNKDINAILGELQGIPEDTLIFTNKLESIKEIIDITGINNSGKGFSEIYSDDLSRITKMYSNTLGSPKQIEFFAREFEFLFGFSFRIDIDFWDDKNKGIDKHTDANYNTLLKFIAMMNMVMGKVWEKDKLPDVLKDYNGLYIKYLQECHIMASITIGSKLCIVSHAGIPYDETSKTFYIPTEIGNVSTGSIDYNKNIIGLNSAYSDFIERIKKGDRSDKEYKKYVAMSANCDDKVIPYSAYASPIVSQKDLDEVKQKKDFDLDVFRKSEKQIYNIYGHQPAGLLPYISRVISNRDRGINETFSYHIDLDISKAEDNFVSNKESYVYLRITKDSDMLFGKTVSEKPYHSIQEEKLQEAPVKVLDYLPKKDKNKLNINYEKEIRMNSLQSYCDNLLQASYKTNVQNTKETDTFTSTLFTVDNNKYYGSFSWTLVEYNKPVKGGRSKVGKAAKAYVKSIKRFLYGKRKMVIYLGKRGGEYVKVKGEYMSLAKFRDKKRI